MLHDLVPGFFPKDDRLCIRFRTGGWPRLAGFRFSHNRLAPTHAGPPGPRSHAAGSGRSRSARASSTHKPRVPADSPRVPADSTNLAVLLRRTSLGSREGPKLRQATAIPDLHVAEGPTAARSLPGGASERVRKVHDAPGCVSLGWPKTRRVDALKAEVIPDEPLPAFPSSFPEGSPAPG